MQNLCVLHRAHLNGTLGSSGCFHVKKFPIAHAHNLRCKHPRSANHQACKRSPNGHLSRNITIIELIFIKILTPATAKGSTERMGSSANCCGFTLFWKADLNANLGN